LRVSVIRVALPSGSASTSSRVAVATPHIRCTKFRATRSPLRIEFAGPRTVAVLTLVGSLVALAFALLLTRQVYLGLGSQREFGYQTAILSVKIWYAYVPAVLSLALLVIAAAITTIENFRVIRDEETS